jgi:hypothetical protein
VKDLMTLFDYLSPSVGQDTNVARSTAGWTTLDSSGNMNLGTPPSVQLDSIDQTKMEKFVNALFENWVTILPHDILMILAGTIFCRLQRIIECVLDDPNKRYADDLWKKHTFFKRLLAAGSVVDWDKEQLLKINDDVYKDFVQENAQGLPSKEVVNVCGDEALIIQPASMMDTLTNLHTNYVKLDTKMQHMQESIIKYKNKLDDKLDDLSGKIDLILAALHPGQGNSEALVGEEKEEEEEEKEEEKTEELKDLLISSKKLLTAKEFYVWWYTHKYPMVYQQALDMKGFKISSSVKSVMAYWAKIVSIVNCFLDEHIHVLAGEEYTTAWKSHKAQVTLKLGVAFDKFEVELRDKKFIQGNESIRLSTFTKSAMMTWMNGDDFHQAINLPTGPDGGCEFNVEDKVMTRDELVKMFISH